MPAPEPTWPQKAQAYKSQLDACREQLERLGSLERDLQEADRRARQVEYTRSRAVDELSRQVDHWRDRAVRAEQDAESARSRIPPLEKALRQAPTEEAMTAATVELAATKARLQEARTQVGASRRQEAFLADRLQHLERLPDQLQQAQQAADTWQRKAMALERELKAATAERDSYRTKWTALKDSVARVL